MLALISHCRNWQDSSLSTPEEKKIDSDRLKKKDVGSHWNQCIYYVRRMSGGHQNAPETLPVLIACPCIYPVSLCSQTVEAAHHCPSLPPRPSLTTVTCSSVSHQRAVRRLKLLRRWGIYCWILVLNLITSLLPQESVILTDTAYVSLQLQAVHIGISPPLLLPRQKQGQLHPDRLSVLPCQTTRLPAPHPGLRARGGRGQRRGGLCLRAPGGHVALRRPHSGLHEHQHRRPPGGARLALRDCRPPDRKPGHQLDLSRAGLWLRDPR